jgi:hypothetical protein
MYEMNSIREAIESVNELFKSLQESASARNISNWVAPPREVIKQQFSASFRVPTSEAKNHPYTVLVRNTFPPCKLALAELEKINISGLTLERRHCGKYLLLKVLEIASSDSIVNILVEDDLGDVAHLCVLCAEFERFEPGSSFILKEPFYELGTISCSRLRCDHPCEILLRWDEPSSSVYQKLVEAAL